MATKIRLKRIGRRNRPFYRLVVMDSRKRRDGAAIEELGWYNPIDVDHSFDIKDERIIHWLQEGAIPTNAAHKLLRRSGIAHLWHLMRQGFDEATIEKEMKKWALNREEVLQARVDQQVEAKTKEEAKSKEMGEESVKTTETDAKVPEEVDPQLEPAETPQDEGDTDTNGVPPSDDDAKIPETVDTEQSSEDEEKQKVSSVDNVTEEHGAENSEDDVSGDDPSQDSPNNDASSAESGADDAVETDDETMENNGAEEGEDAEDTEGPVAENEDSEEE